MRALNCDPIELALVIYGHLRFMGAAVYGVTHGDFVLGARSGKPRSDAIPDDVALAAVFDRYDHFRTKYRLDMPDPLVHFTEYPVDRYVALAKVVGVISRSLVPDLTELEDEALTFRRRDMFYRIEYVGKYERHTPITTISIFPVLYDEEAGRTESRKQRPIRHLRLIYDCLELIERNQKLGLVDQPEVLMHRGLRYLEDLTARQKQGIVKKKMRLLRPEDEGMPRYVYRVSGKWRERFIERFGEDWREDGE